VSTVTVTPVRVTYGTGDRLLLEKLNVTVWSLVPAAEATCTLMSAPVMPSGGSEATAFTNMPGA
jgi:hypothetical protein